MSAAEATRTSSLRLRRQTSLLFADGGDPLLDGIDARPCRLRKSVSSSKD